MAKGKGATVYFCSNCGHESAKWLGQCPGCREWNTFVEEMIDKEATRKTVRSKSEPAMQPVALSAIEMSLGERISTQMEEMDRVLGGGVVPHSMILVGGDPGIGKSTLLLQVCRNLSLQGKEILYISGEESLTQIKIRANRIGAFSESMRLLCETDMDRIDECIRRYKPEFVVIDSIQTMYRSEISSAPGSVSQVRETTSMLMQMAKGYGVTVFIVGHVTKEGTVAGPRVLEHMVDTVLYFEGDRHASYRILRSVKNRFGSTNEIGVFAMKQSGLEEVLNPSEYMLSGRPKDASGSMVSCSMEGSRPILVEIQALICQSSFGIPRRQATGTDMNRLNLLMAVMEKRMQLQMSGCDAYINIAGGIKVLEPAIDLGIVMAVISSYKNKALPDDWMAIGEVGLSGEIRAVSMIEQRIMEARKLGFKNCILPKVHMQHLSEMKGIRCIGVESVQDVLRYLTSPEQG